MQLKLIELAWKTNLSQSDSNKGDVAGLARLYSL